MQRLNDVRRLVLIGSLLLLALLLRTTSLAAVSTPQISWRIELDIPVDPAQVKSQGGMPGAANYLLRQMATSIPDKTVAYSVKIKNNTTFLATIQGNAGLAQLRQTLFTNLRKQVSLMGATSSVTLTGPVTSGQKVSVVLDSRPPTGYQWMVQTSSGQALALAGSPSFQSMGNWTGASSKQTLQFTGASATQTNLTLVYRRPFEKPKAATQRVYIDASALPGVVDLTGPALPPPPKPPIKPRAAKPLPGVASLPAAFDWMAQGKVTPIEDQGPCGSCWSFATVGAMEAAIKIKDGLDVDLSEQYLISCNSEGWNCENGGWWAHDYHTNKVGLLSNPPGAVLASDMPYIDADGTCKYLDQSHHPYKLDSWNYVGAAYAFPPPTVTALKTAIYTYGPIDVAICAGPAFGAYRGGVFSTEEAASTCNGWINHAVVLTGWDDSTQTWELRNSWGPYWGENGYMRIRYGTSLVGYNASYVVYKGSAVQPPATPSALHATAITSSTVTLKWNDNSSNEDGFKVYRQNGSTWTQVGSTGVNTTTFTDTGLACTSDAQHPSSYTYRVTAANSAGESQPSATTSATTTTCSIPNDLRSGSLIATSLPFYYGQVVNASTKSADDPPMSCSSYGPTNYTNTVWYKYTPVSYQQGIQISTVGSDYDTVVAVYNLDNQGNLNEVACNDDYTDPIIDRTSQFAFIGSPTTYYIMVAQGGVTPLLSTNTNQLHISIVELPIPQQAQLVSPSTTLFTDSPDFIWQKSAYTEWYYLWITNPTSGQFAQWYTSPSICPDPDTLCTVPSPYLQEAGTHQWAVDTYAGGLYGPWSRVFTYTVYPSTPVIKSPSPTVFTSAPSYSWDMGTSTSWYYLQVAGPGGKVFDGWYNTDGICTNGTCTVKPNKTLVNGQYTMWVQGMQNSLLGDWATETFQVIGQATPQIIPISPYFTAISTNHPTYVWQASAAQWYYLYINDAYGGHVFDGWYNAGAICSAGNCSVTPPVNLPTYGYEYVWWVEGYTNGVYSPWTPGAYFYLSSPAAAKPAATFAPTFAPGQK